MTSRTYWYKKSYWCNVKKWFTSTSLRGYQSEKPLGVKKKQKNGREAILKKYIRCQFLNFKNIANKVWN